MHRHLITCMVNFFWFEVVYPVKPKAAWSADAARIKRINRAAKLRFVRLAFHGERERENYSFGAGNRVCTFYDIVLQTIIELPF